MSVETVIAFFLEHGSYGLMIAALVAAGLGLPLPEDIVMISGAILAQRGITDLSLTVLALTVGVFLGDSALFLIARKVGPAIYEWRWIKRVMPAPRRAWIEDRIAKHGMLVVFFARHVAGFRGPTFAIAAIHGISYARFIIADMIALAISLPLWMALGWFFSDSIDELLNRTATAERLILVGVVGVVLLIVVGHAISTWVKRRRQASAEREAARDVDHPSTPPPPARGTGALAE